MTYSKLLKKNLRPNLGFLDCASVMKDSTRWDPHHKSPYIVIINNFSWLMDMWIMC